MNKLVATVVVASAFDDVVAVAVAIVDVVAAVFVAVAAVVIVMMFQNWSYFCRALKPPPFQIPKLSF